MNLSQDQIILKPRMTVCGIGGAGGNAINNMIASGNFHGIHEVSFVVANTDAQALEFSHAERKIQLGIKTTRGLGAGASPEIGKAAAEESSDDIRKYIESSNMVFITAGMGGGTGTGATSVVARIAKDLGILTVGVVTKPFFFEGAHRMRIAEAGLLELQKHVDTLIVIPNQNLFRIANENTTFSEAFKMADNVLRDGVLSITDLITRPGLINLDFADIKSIMSAMGKSVMGSGQSQKDSMEKDRAIRASEAAISNPLLDHSSIRGARGVLINITGGSDMTLFEVDSAANRIREEVGNPDANIIFGSTFNPDLEGVIRVSVVATGIEDLTKTITQKDEIVSEPNKLNQILDHSLMPPPALPENIQEASVEKQHVVANEIGKDMSNKNKSIFSQIWNQVGNTNIKQNTDDMYEVPAFLRRPNK